MPVDVLVGLQWGDEGKGKIVDYLSKNYHAVARFQGGPNAGHTLVVGGTKFILHTVPSGIINESTANYIGAGTVIDPIVLRKEIETLLSEDIEVGDRLRISDKAHLILPTHKYLDAQQEEQKGAAKIGSTLRGIGPTYQDKYSRTGLTMGQILLNDFTECYTSLKKSHIAQLHSFDHGELAERESEWHEAVSFLKGYPIISVEDEIQELLEEGKSVLAEGAQGTLLDISFGSYPYVTSSHTLASSACIGLGIPPQSIRKVFGIFKAYMTRVGEGPFPTELTGEIGDTLMTAGHEFGSTTGRARRCGWLDLNLLKKAVWMNGVTDLIITKADVLTCVDQFNAASLSKGTRTFESWKENIASCSSRLDLPQSLREYLGYIEEYTSTPISLISTGPARAELIDK